MDQFKGWITGGIITLVIGGATYSFNQEAVVSHLSEETGMTQGQAEEYVNNIKDEDMVTYTQLGVDLTTAGEKILSEAEEIDCENYEYDWETPSLTCSSGKLQLITFAKDSTSLGNAYKILDSDSAANNDIQNVITGIDKLNTDYKLPIIIEMYNSEEIKEMTDTNSFNKALLQSAIESKQTN